MRVSSNILVRQFERYKEEYEQKALDILRGGWYVLGNEVRSFETEFASYVGAKHCVGLASGLDSLWIAFRVLGIGAGDEVIVPANTYIASVMGITIAGATPIFVEPDIYNNIDPMNIEEKITKNTKAILPVHLYGQACRMNEIMNLANKYGLRVVEDCAQSHGAYCGELMTGNIGDIGCFSFYPSKNLGAFGDAGAIVTNNDVLAKKFTIFRNYGSEKRYFNKIIGANSRLDEFQAGLLRVKLTHIDELNEERRILAQRYLTHISNPHIDLPTIAAGTTTTWHLFVIRTKHRDKFVKYLNEHEIETIIHYPIPPHLSEAYMHLGYKTGDFPITEQYANEVLTLPLFNGMTEDEQNYVIDVLNKFGG